MCGKNASRRTKPSASQTQLKRRTTLSMQASSRRSKSNLDVRNNALVNVRRFGEMPRSKITPRRTQMNASQSEFEGKTSVGLAYRNRKKSSLDHTNNAGVKVCSWKIPSENIAPTRIQLKAPQSQLERGTRAGLAATSEVNLIWIARIMQLFNFTVFGKFHLEKSHTVAHN